MSRVGRLLPSRLHLGQQPLDLLKQVLVDELIRNSHASEVAHVGAKVRYQAVVLADALASASPLLALPSQRSLFA
jgi:hypothetical protein